MADRSVRVAGPFRRWLGSRWGVVTQAVSVVAVLALVASGALVTRGLSEQEPRVRTDTVWAVNNGAHLYGWVNTAVDELEGVVEPEEGKTPTVTQVLQYGDDAAVVTGGSVVGASQASPTALGGTSTGIKVDQLAAQRGKWAVFLAEDGASLIAGSVRDFAAGEKDRLVTIDPPESSAEVAEEEAGASAFVAATVDDQGEVAGLTRAGVLVEQSLTAPESGQTVTTFNSELDLAQANMVQLTRTGSDYVALAQAGKGSSAPTTFTLASRSAKAQLTEVESASIPVASVSDDSVVVSTSAGLVTWDGGDSDPSKPSGGPSGGTVMSTARPVTAEGKTYAAWATASGVFVTDADSDQPEKAEVPGNFTASKETQLSFIWTGDRLALNDLESGLVWEHENGTWALVPSSAKWIEAEQQQQTTSESETEEQTQQVCPTAQEAELGARAGRVTTLPLLLWATDENRNDAISIVPDSVKWKGEGLGDLSVVNDAQQVTVNIEAGKTGTGTIEYQLTDGQKQCPATFTAQVKIVDDAENAEPVFKGTTTQRASALTVGARGTIRWQELAGWYDPDGDPVYLSDASAKGLDPSSTVAATPSGEVVFQAGANQEKGDVPVTLSVSDGTETATRTVNVQVQDAAQPSAEPFSVTVKQNSPTSVLVRDYLQGVGEDVTLAVKPQAGDESGLSVSVLSDGLGFSLTGAKVGTFTVEYTIESGDEEGTGTFRVTVVETAKLSVAPFNVFLLPDQDARVEALGTAQYTGDGVLTAESPVIAQSGVSHGASLDPAVYDGSMLRVSGSTADGKAGRIGTFTYPVTDGDERATAQVTVYQLSSDSGVDPVAVPDVATARKGSPVDIDVLDNDLAPGGGTLMLDPRSETLVEDQDAQDAGVLAFVSGNRLRLYVPASYTKSSVTLRYEVYVAGNSTLTGRASVRVDLSDASGQNSPPTSPLLEGRVAAGGTATLSVDAYGLDPDGDRTTVTAVTQPKAGGSVELAKDGLSMNVTSTGEAGSLLAFSYTISDGKAESEGSVKVAVTDDALSSQIVAFDDQREATENEALTVLPLLNDSYPQGTVARLCSVERVKTQSEHEQEASGDGDASQSVTASGTCDPESSNVKGSVLIDTAAQSVTVTPGSGTTRYAYTAMLYKEGEAEDAVSIGMAQAEIVVSTGGGTAVPDYPIVSDSTVSQTDLDGDSFSLDVMTDKVAYAGSGTLSLGLVSAKDGYSVSGSKIRGTLTDTAQVVPFKISTGVPSDPDVKDSPEVASYGFLYVPKRDSIPPELKKTVTLDVNEGESASTAPLSRLVVPVTGKQLQLLSVSAAQRAGATCKVDTSTTTVTYDAGDGKTGEADTCLVEARWKGEASTVTQLRVDVKVTLNAAPPTLSGRALGKVAPSGTLTFDLRRATDWAAGDVNTIAYSTGGMDLPEGVKATVSDRHTLTVQAGPTALPTGAFQIPISADWGGGEPVTATFTTSVDNATQPAESLPNLQVEVSQKKSGADTVAEFTEVFKGMTDEMGAGWAVDTIQAPQGTTGSVTGQDSFSVTIPANKGGGHLTGTYTAVGTREGRTGFRGTGNFTIVYNAIPNAPELKLTGYTANSVTFLLSEVGSTTPPVTGLKLTSGESCTPDTSGSCSVTVQGLKPNQKHAYTAVATNKAGDSDGSKSVNAWAYENITVSAGTWTPVGDGTVRLAFTSSAAGSVSVDGGETSTKEANKGPNELTVSGVGNAETSVRVTVTNSMDPPLEGKVTAGDADFSGVHGVWEPIGLSLQASNDDGKLKLEAKATKNGGDIEYSFGTSKDAARDGTYGAKGKGEIDSLELYVEATVWVCARSVFGGKVFGDPVCASEKARPWKEPDLSGAKVTYTVDKSPNGSGEYAISWNSASYTVSGKNFTLTYSAPSVGYGDTPPDEVTVTPVYQGTQGSPKSVPVEAENSDRQYPVKVTVSKPSDDTCANWGTASAWNGTIHADSSDYEVDVTKSGTTYTYRVQWKNDLAGLDNYTKTETCTPPTEDSGGEDTDP